MSTAKTKTRAIDYNKQRVRERRERWIKQVGSMSELYFNSLLVLLFHFIAYCTCRTRNILFSSLILHLHCFPSHLGFHMYIILVHIDLNIVRCPLLVILTVIGR